MANKTTNIYKTYVPLVHVRMFFQNEMLKIYLHLS